MASPPRGWDIVRRVFAFPRLIATHWDLIATSVRRELDARFTGTVLGWAWPLIHPLFLFAVYYFIFTKLLNFKIPELPEGQQSALGVFMFCGIIVFSTIGESLSRGTPVIVENGNLIKKLAFPSEVLPLNVVLVSQITLLFAAAMFVVACIVTPVWPAPGWALLWIPLLVLAQTVFTYGLALLLATLQVFLRDTQQIVTVGITIWMFITPLFWVPELMGGEVATYLPWIKLNPVYHLVQAWRGVLMGDLVVWVESLGGMQAIVSGEAVARHLSIFSIWALVSYVCGYSVFVLSQRRFADEV